MCKKSNFFIRECLSIVPCLCRWCGSAWSPWGWPAPRSSASWPQGEGWPWAPGTWAPPYRPARSASTSASFGSSRSSLQYIIIKIPFELHHYHDYNHQEHPNIITKQLTTIVLLWPIRIDHHWVIVIVYIITGWSWLLLACSIRSSSTLTIT